MKYYLTILSLLLLIACDNKNGYTIKGRVVNNTLDGEYVYLQKIDNDSLITIDSALVEDSEFRFKGILIDKAIREISFKNKSKNVLTPLIFILEKGDHTAYIDTLSYMTGSRLNDDLHEFYINQSYYNVKIKTLLNDYRNQIIADNLTDSLLMAFQGWYDLLIDEKKDQAYTFITMNNDNIAGALVFLQNFNILNNYQIEMIIENAGMEFVNVPGIKIIENQLDIEKRTAVGNDYINFSLPDRDKEMVSIKSLIDKGDWVLLAYWRADCITCENDYPYLNEAYKKYKKYGFEIVGIYIDDDKMIWTRRTNPEKIKWIELTDFKGWNSKPALLYGVNQVPFTVLIDPEGKIVAKGLRQEVLLAELEKIFYSQSHKN